jgi:hypothetical protein
MSRRSQTVKTSPKATVRWGLRKVVGTPTAGWIQPLGQTESGEDARLKKAVETLMQELK